MYFSEAGSRVLQLVDHGPLNGGQIQVGIVHQRPVFSVQGTTVLLIAWLVEVGVWNHDQALD